MYAPCRISSFWSRLTSRSRGRMPWSPERAAAVPAACPRAIHAVIGPCGANGVRANRDVPPRDEQAVDLLGHHDSVWKVIRRPRLQQSEHRGLPIGRMGTNRRRVARDAIRESPRGEKVLCRQRILPYNPTGFSHADRETRAHDIRVLEPGNEPLHALHGLQESLPGLDLAAGQIPHIGSVNAYGTGHVQDDFPRPRRGVIQQEPILEVLPLLGEQALLERLPAAPPAGGTCGIPGTVAHA